MLLRILQPDEWYNRCKGGYPIIILSISDSVMLVLCSISVIELDDNYTFSDFTLDPVESIVLFHHDGSVL